MAMAAVNGMQYRAFAPCNNDNDAHITGHSFILRIITTTYHYHVIIVYENDLQLLGEEVERREQPRAVTGGRRKAVCLSS
jgi:hypothetical protein